MYQISAAPKPEVQHLPTIFRRVTSGELRIPAFQREFVWSNTQMLSLLDSVYRGFPISSLLFWRVNSNILKTQNKRNFPAANEDAPFPHSFVLDGLQRLTTLYGVFNFDEKQFDEIFNVAFDLENEEFVPAKAWTSDDRAPQLLPLNHVFNPRSFLSDQKAILELSDGNILVDRAIRLHSIFQEYMLPLVTIESESVADVVRIFERINNTGTKLSSVDFMRAVTWSEDFDLTRELRALSEFLEDLGFSFEDETLVKCLAVDLGREPTATSMLSLQECDDVELHTAVTNVKFTLQRVIQFFQSNFGIQSVDFVPYEMHIVVLSHLFSETTAERLGEAARKWFLASALDESLRGRSDAYTSRLLSLIDYARETDTFEPFDYRVAAQPDLFVDRRLIKGRALSAAFAILFALRGARSFTDGNVIPIKDYLSAFSPAAYEPILPFFDFGRTEYATHRRMANLALVGKESISKHTLRDHIIKMRRTHPAAVFESQFLTSRAMDALEAGDSLEFAFARSEAMLEFAESVLDDSIEWPELSQG